MTRGEVFFWAMIIVVVAILSVAVISLVQVGNEAAAFIDQHGIRGVVEHLWCGKELPGCLSK